jgi:hypothetical protein
MKVQKSFAGFKTSCRQLSMVKTKSEKLRRFQNKLPPTVNGKDKVSVTTLMASMAVALVKGLDAKCIVVLDAYFAVGPVLLILKGLLDSNGKRLAHLITRAKRNV